jgi:hypothetical protein
MEIEAKRWLFTFSACALGWVCGFIIYSMLVLKIQLMAPVTQFQQHSQVLQHHHAGDSISHAVVRMVQPAEISPPAGCAHIMPHNHIDLEPNRSYYL